MSQIKMAIITTRYVFATATISLMCSNLAIRSESRETGRAAEEVIEVGVDAVRARLKGRGRRGSREWRWRGGRRRERAKEGSQNLLLGREEGPSSVSWQGGIAPRSSLPDSGTGYTRALSKQTSRREEKWKTWRGFRG